jgi:pilus assembly protein FimV
MFRRTLVWLSCMIAIVLANYTVALGLGEISSFSTINEPFHAEIRLRDVGHLTRDEIIVGFASNEDFQRSQLDRHYFFNDFSFELLLEDLENPRVKITSHKIVREPFLGFIIDARWPDGRVQREYTILLDKPSAIE